MSFDSKELFKVVVKPLRDLMKKRGSTNKKTVIVIDEECVSFDFGVDKSYEEIKAFLKGNSSAKKR